MNLNKIKLLCSLTKEKLEEELIFELRLKGYNRMEYTEDYIIAEGDLPICLIAHMDTVFLHNPKIENFFYDQKEQALWYPGGSGFDDRAGIYAILTLIEKGYRPSVIFTDKEECGGLGSRALIKRFPHCPFNDCRALIQLDRANKNDMVFYDCDNVNFEKYIKKFGFKMDFGTFTDISIIAPQWEVAAVNLSVGYYLEHSSAEYLKCKELDQTINKVEKILKKSPNMDFYKYEKIEYLQHFEKERGIESCLVCGRKINKNIDGYCIPHLSPYIVCHYCYERYYNNDELDEQKIANNNDDFIF